MTSQLAAQWAPVIIVIIGWIWAIFDLKSTQKSNSKEIERLEKLVEKYGKDLHRYNTNTQGVINEMKEKQIIPTVESVKNLEKSQELQNQVYRDMKKSFGKIYDEMHALGILVASIPRGNASET